MANAARLGRRRPIGRSPRWRLPAIVSAGQNVSLNAAGSAAACGRTVASFAWTVVAPARESAGRSSARTPRRPPSSPRPRVRSRLRVTVTDNQGQNRHRRRGHRPDRVTSSAPLPAAGSAACAAPVTSGPDSGGSAHPAPTPAPLQRRRVGGGGGGGSVGPRPAHLARRCWLAASCGDAANLRFRRCI